MNNQEKVIAGAVSWERIRMILTLRRGEGGVLPPVSGGVLVGPDRILAAELTPCVEETADSETQKLCLNVTNAGNCRCVRPGTYRCLVRFEGEDSWSPVYAAPAAREGAEQAFSYGGSGNRYCVSCRPGKGGQLEIRVRDEKKEEPLSLRKMYTLGMRGFLRLSYRVMHRLARKKDRRILLMTEQNEKPDENLLALRDRMRERGLTESYELQESCRVTVTGKHLGFRSWLSVTAKLAGAGTVFLDDHAPILDWLVLAPDTTVVQLWHAGIGFKSSGYSRWGHAGSPAPFSAHRQYTFGVCTSEKNREIFAELWGISKGMVLPAGMPRLDRFLDPAFREKTVRRLRKRFPGIEGKRVILFAPTYRGVNRKNADYPYDKIDFPALYELCGEDTVTIFKMHPWIKGAVPVPERFRDRLIDAGSASDINELFLITDLLITDYSSDIFEFSLMKRPMLFYAFDREAYGKARGFHGDYREMAPGKIAESFPELLQAIQKGDFEEERAEQYRKRHFDRTDTGNADRVIDWILLGKMPGELRREWQRAGEQAARIGKKWTGAPEDGD